ncbi:MAG: hypothetical protein NTY38_06495, partial [Acidobacteria bacterium]|nr:hypothetical protein [Acidobacteriota bacterium]
MFRFHTLSLTLAVLLYPAAAIAGPAEEGLLFHASLDHSATADFAAGSPKPLVSQDLRLVKAYVELPRAAVLAYDAHANLYAEQGTLSFWWRPDEPPDPVGFPVFMSFYEQDSTWGCNFLRVEWNGRRLAARIRDRNLVTHTVEGPLEKPVAGRWMHIAATWSEAGGMWLYLDGKPGGHAPGPLVTFFGFLLRGTPPQWGGALSPGAIDDIRIYRAPVDVEGIRRLARRLNPERPAGLPAPEWAARFGWSETANIPSGSRLAVKRLAIRDAKIFGKLWLKGADGKRETLWPMADKFPVGADGLYLDEGKRYRVFPGPEPMNLVRTTGNLEGRISIAPQGSYARSGQGELHYHRLESSVTVPEVTVDRQSGMLGDLECLRVEAAPKSGKGPWTRFAPADDARIASRRDRGRFAVWKPAAGHTTALRRGAGASGVYQYFLLPVTREVALQGVRVRMAASPGALYYAAVEDPVNTVRQLIEVDVRATGRSLELTLEFPPLLVPGGSEVVLTVASSEGGAPGLEAQLLT